MNKIRAIELFNSYEDADLLTIPTPNERETVADYVRRVPESVNGSPDPLFSLLLTESTEQDREMVCDHLRERLGALQAVIDDLSG